MNRRRPRVLPLAAMHGSLLFALLAPPGCSLDSPKPLAQRTPVTLASPSLTGPGLPIRQSFRARRVAPSAFPKTSPEVENRWSGPIRVDERHGFRRYAVAYVLPRAVVADHSTIPVALSPTAKPPETPELAETPPRESPPAPPVLPRLRVRTTAYTHTELDHIRYGRKTARGDRLKFGKRRSAAADWSRFPVGTEFRIVGQPGITYVIDDYGSALTGTNTIDLYKPSTAAMNHWGVRHVEIELVKWGSFAESLRIMRPRRHWPHVARMAAAIDDAGRQPSVHLAPLLLH